MNNKRKIWIILLIVGIIPIALPILGGIVGAINGFSGLCILECESYHGITAFRDAIILYSFIFWPTYIIGTILIILSIIKLKKLNPKSVKNQIKNQN